MQIIRRNFTLKLLALSLAILGWAYFRFAANPIVAAARFDQQISVPIVVVNLPTGYVAHFTEREAVVTVQARRGDPAIKPDEIKAVLDLSSKTPGVYNVPIELVAPQVAVQSLSPATIALTIERVESRDVALTVHYAGEPSGRPSCRAYTWHPGRSRSKDRSRCWLKSRPSASTSSCRVSRRSSTKWCIPSQSARREAKSEGSKSRRISYACRCTSLPAANRSDAMSLFGTDGIRGIANAELTPELAFQVGRAGAAALAAAGKSERSVMVGRDTRISGTMLEAALVAGIASAGCDAITLGVLPTPGVACVTRCEEALGGVVISASHNPVGDNGIKFFGSDGFKLSDDAERTIESLLGSTDLPRPTGTGVGIVRAAQNLGRHYYRHLYALGVDLHGLHVVVDAAFGAAFAVAPYALRKLGATVTELHCENDGSRINVGSGATDLRPLQLAVRARIDAGERRVVGVAFDGDADRALFVDETGSAVSGDHVMFAIGGAMHDAGELTHDTVVGTTMSNFGFERALARARHRAGARSGRRPVRAGAHARRRFRARRRTVGPRHRSAAQHDRRRAGDCDDVAAASRRMRRHAARVGLGDQSVPQVLLNVRTRSRDVLGADSVRAAIAAGEARLGKADGFWFARPARSRLFA